MEGIVRYLSFLRDGKEGYGCIVGDGVCDLGRRTGFSSLAAHIAHRVESLGAEDNATADFLLSDITFLPVIPQPSKVLCVATNYFEPEDKGDKRPDYPLLFSRFAASQTGHGQALLKPSVSEKLDYEGELAVIIGRGGRFISEDDALHHVAGYSCFNDGSVRDWQKHSSQFTPGKNFVKTGGFGPWMVSRDEILDPSNLDLRTRVNGEIRQANNTSRLIFSIPWLIAYVSQFTVLEAGDVLVTGTPSGFGSLRSPPCFLQDGDVVEVEIERVGTLRNVVRSDPSI